MGLNLLWLDEDDSPRIHAIGSKEFRHFVVLAQSGVPRRPEALLAQAGD